MQGGGLFIGSGGSATLEDCVFSNNTAFEASARFLEPRALQRPNKTLRDACFFACFRMQGGGLAIEDGGSATLNSCQILRNEASSVVLAFRTFWTFLPVPQWNVT